MIQGKTPLRPRLLPQLLHFLAFLPALPRFFPGYNQENLQSESISFHPFQGIAIYPHVLPVIVVKNPSYPG